MKVFHRTCFHRIRIVKTAALLLLVASFLLSACSRSEGNPAVDSPKQTASPNGQHQAAGQHQPEKPQQETGVTSLNSSQPQAEPSAAPTPALHEAPAEHGAAAQNADAAAQPSQTKDPQKDTLAISIIGDQESGTILPPTQVKYEAGKTVFDILLQVLKDKGIQFEFRGRGPTVYIEGIDNLYEFDRGPKSGWMFCVNGVFSAKSAGAYTLHKGDRIEWLYTLDLGKDLRGKSE